MPLRVALTGLVGRAYSPPNLTNMDCRAIEVNACVERGTEIGIFHGVEYLEKCHGTYSDNELSTRKSFRWLEKNINCEPSAPRIPQQNGLSPSYQRLPAGRISNFHGKGLFFSFFFIL
jgi:hypothetical protein